MKLSLKIAGYSILLLGVAMVFIPSCTFHNEAEYFSEIKCDTTETVVYEGFVKATIEENCISCHSAAVSEGGVNLETYAQVKAFAEIGDFLSSINWDGGASFMPQGQAQLPQCTIDKIEKWIREGMPEK